MDCARFHLHLHLNRIKRTAARDIIFETLWFATPCTLAELLHAVEGKAAQATVYRTIPLFLTLRIIEEIQPGTYEISDLFRQHRHHFICRLCHRRVAFRDNKLETALTEAARRSNFALEEHSFELTGICPYCTSLKQAHPRPAIGNGLIRPIGR
jgi:Fe2+ or Zn2+ uptake regulation protein